MEPSTSKNLKRLFTLLLVILIIAALGYAVWASKQKIVDIENQLQTAQNQIGHLQSQLHQQQNNLEQLQQTVNSDQDTWVLAEVDNRVQAADYALRFLHDIPTALVLLQSADNRMSTLSGSHLITIRQLLAKNIAVLHAAKPVDIAGILARLGALQEQATQLTIKSVPVVAETTATPEETIDKHTSWREALAISWRAVQKLIVIRRTDQPIAPVMTAEQQAHLQQNLQALLQEAQLAVLRSQQDIYQSSLQQAQRLIQQNFVTTTLEAESILQAIDKLQETTIQPTLPDLTELMRAVKQAASGD